MKSKSAQTPVRWSEREVAYIYSYSKKVETIVTEGELRGVEIPPDLCKQANEFLSEAEAVVNLRNKKKQEYVAQLEEILPELETMDITNMSLSEMEAMESKFIERLDSLRIFDPKTDEYVESEEFLVLEEKLNLLQAMIHCWSQEIYTAPQDTDTPGPLEPVEMSSEPRPLQDVVPVTSQGAVVKKKGIRSLIKNLIPLSCLAVKMKNIV